MKIARYKSSYEKQHPEDIERMRQILIKKDIVVPETDLVVAWAKYSSTKNTNWLLLPDSDEEIYNAIINYFLVENW
jgi:hypothetical protein